MAIAVERNFAFPRVEKSKIEVPTGIPWWKGLLAKLDPGINAEFQIGGLGFRVHTPRGLDTEKYLTEAELELAKEGIFLSKDHVYSEESNRRKTMGFYLRERALRKARPIDFMVLPNGDPV